MNSRERRTWLREISTEGGKRRKRNADRRFAIRDAIAEQRQEAARIARSRKQMYPWKSRGAWTKGWPTVLSRPTLEIDNMVGYAIPSLPTLPPSIMYTFTSRYDDENGVDQGWHDFQCTDVELREIFSDGTKSENLLGTGSLEDKRIGWMLPKRQDNHV